MTTHDFDDVIDEVAPAVPDADLYDHCSDVGNAARFAVQHHDRAKFCHALNTWMLWDGEIWRPDTIGAVQHLAVDTVRTIYHEAALLPTKAERDTRAKWAATSESDSRLHALLSLARANLPVRLEQLDADPWKLTVANGTIDLHTGLLHPHGPVDLITKRSPVAYDVGAVSPLWDAVITRALPDPPVRRFLQKCIGYTLTGTTGEDVLIVAHGPTRTSKGTVQDALAAMLGDYALSAELDLLAERDRPGGPRPDLVRLRGARMINIYETSRRLKLSAAFVKSWTGSDPITARDLFARPLTFRPEGKLWVTTNHRPMAAADDEALWTRIREVPFVVTIPEAERDPRVRAQLREPDVHGAAILRWAVEGCLLWQTEGLAPPDAVRAATRSYRESMNPIGAFVADQCVLLPDAWTLSTALRAAYEQWAKQNGEPAIDGRAFQDALRQAGCDAERRHAGRGWNGIGLHADA